MLVISYVSYTTHGSYGMWHESLGDVKKNTSNKSVMFVHNCNHQGKYVKGIKQKHGRNMAYGLFGWVTTVVLKLKSRYMENPSPSAKNVTLFYGFWSILNLLSRKYHQLPNVNLEIWKFGTILIYKFIPMQSYFIMNKFDSHFKVSSKPSPSNIGYAFWVNQTVLGKKTLPYSDPYLLWELECHVALKKSPTLECHLPLSEEYPK